MQRPPRFCFSEIQDAVSGRFVELTEADFEGTRPNVPTNLPRSRRDDRVANSNGAGANLFVSSATPVLIVALPSATAVAPVARLVENRRRLLAADPEPKMADCRFETGGSAVAD
jgi:hypothetical protein